MFQLLSLPCFSLMLSKQSLSPMAGIFYSVFSSQFLLKKPLRLAGCDVVKYEDVWSSDLAGPPNQPLGSRLELGTREQRSVMNSATSAVKEASSSTCTSRNMCSTSSLIPIMFSKSENIKKGVFINNLCFKLVSSFLGFQH